MLALMTRMSRSFWHWCSTTTELIADTEHRAAGVLIESFAEHAVTVTVRDFGALMGTTGPESDEGWREFLRRFVTWSEDLASVGLARPRAAGPDGARHGD